MKETPYPVSIAMVRAILDGTKTQESLAIVSSHIHLPTKGSCFPAYKYTFAEFDGVLRYRNIEIADGFWLDAPRCKFGGVGDRLWVREEWHYFGGREYEYQQDKNQVIYRADLQVTDMGSWRPSIFMPRWASRITLEITGVRVERVQDITEQDSIAEGIDYFDSAISVPARERFAVLWDTINAKRGFGYEVNPWVRVIEFKKV